MNFDALGGAELVGALAGLITTICYLPQALHVIRSRQTGGISLLGYSLLFIGVSLWTVYGILIVKWPLIIANAISLLLIGVILVMKLRLG